MMYFILQPGSALSITLPLLSRSASSFLDASQLCLVFFSDPRAMLWLRHARDNATKKHLQLSLYLPLRWAAAYTKLPHRSLK